MTVARVAVLSGFTGRFCEAAKRAMAARQISVASVPLTGNVTAEYCSELARRALQLVLGVEGPKEDIQVLLVSCLSKMEKDQEREALFPSLRRLEVPVGFRADIHLARQLSETVAREYRNQAHLTLARAVKASAQSVICLPIENSKSRRLRAEIEAIYFGEAFSLSRTLDKEIVRRKGGRGLRIRDLDFCGRVNGPEHPVRRCTDDPTCDLRAALRLGFPVPPRFEFDVSCEAGLAGKEFVLCGGTKARVSRAADHLNMRINGDYREGTS